MCALLQNPLWRLAVRDRFFQRLFGRISCIFLAVAFAALFDGLVAQMRTGHEQLDLLPGEKVTVSGPAALKNPLASDIIARFAPESAPLQFGLEGFFTGYWFGSGMWRGHITACPQAEPGRYFLRVSFRGASARHAQQYALNVYENAKAMRSASHSFLRRRLGVNPFKLAAGAGGLGLLSGLATYGFGRMFTRRLRSLGLVQVYSRNRNDGTIQCLAPRDMAPPAGNSRMVFSAAGAALGEARCLAWQKGKLKLKLPDDRIPPDDALVCLKHPWAGPDKDMPGTGTFN